MTIRRRSWSAGRRSSDVDGSWRSGVRARIFHQRKGGRGQLAPDRVGPAQRQGCAVMLNQRDSAHRAATGAALRAVAGRNTRSIGAALPRLVALVGPCRPVRGGRIGALGGLRPSRPARQPAASRHGRDELSPASTMQTTSGRPERSPSMPSRGCRMESRNSTDSWDQAVRWSFPWGKVNGSDDALARIGYRWPVR